MLVGFALLFASGWCCLRRSLLVVFVVIMFTVCYDVFWVYCYGLFVLGLGGLVAGALLLADCVVWCYAAFGGCRLLVCASRRLLA